MTADELFEGKKPGEQFELTIAGEGKSSFWKKARCGYYEWVFGEEQNGQLTSYVKGEQTGEAVVVDLGGGKQVSVEPRRLRPRLKPAFEKTFEAGDKALPEGLKNPDDPKKPVYVAEWCLEVGKTYFATVLREGYALPPTGPGQKPQHKSNAVLVISDQPLKDGKPQGELTPAYRNWSY